MLLWSDAMQRALYGTDGFYRTGAGAGGHFRTSVHASHLFAEALARLVVEVDLQLDKPQSLDVVDIGADRGTLLESISQHLPRDLTSRVNLVAVEVRDRPVGLSDAIVWRDHLPSSIHGLVIANEWLDNVPVDIVERTPDGLAQVLVDPTDGTEQLEPLLDRKTSGWVERWWSLGDAPVGARAEVGGERDDAWREVVGRMQRGVCVAADYFHTREHRVRGDYSVGTLAGFRDGRAVAPVPDGSCDITAHVALDACAEAAATTKVHDTLLTTQRNALQALGVSGARPPIDDAATKPEEYVRRLARASHAGELLDRSGLGGFGWLVQSREISLPPSFRTLATVDERPRSPGWRQGTIPGG